MLDLDDYEKWTSENTMHIGFRKMRELIAECRRHRVENEVHRTAMKSVNDELIGVRAFARDRIDRLKAECEELQALRDENKRLNALAEWVAAISAGMTSDDWRDKMLASMSEKDKRANEMLQEIERLKAKEAIDLKALGEANARNTKLAEDVAYHANKASDLAASVVAISEDAHDLAATVTELRNALDEANANNAVLRASLQGMADGYATLRKDAERWRAVRRYARIADALFPIFRSDSAPYNREQTDDASVKSDRYADAIIEAAKGDKPC